MNRLNGRVLALAKTHSLRSLLISHNRIRSFVVGLAGVLENCPVYDDANKNNNRRRRTMIELKQTRSSVAFASSIRLDNNNNNNNNNNNRSFSTSSSNANTKDEQKKEEEERIRRSQKNGKRGNERVKEEEGEEGEHISSSSADDDDDDDENDSNEKNDVIMAEKDQLIVELNERHLRTLADMENLRARTQRQSEDAKKFAVQGFAKDLLDVADNMDRACQTVTEDIINEALSDAKKLETLLRSFKEGVELTQKQLNNAFKKNGLVKFDPVDEAFDANEHMALFNVPVQGTKKEAGSVAVVTKVGYRLHGRVIRAAECGVYK